MGLGNAQEKTFNNERCRGEPMCSPFFVCAPTFLCLHKPPARPRTDNSRPAVRSKLSHQHHSIHVSVGANPCVRPFNKIVFALILHSHFVQSTKQIGLCGETGYPLCEMSVKNVELSEPKASFRRSANEHTQRVGSVRLALTVPFKREQSRTCSSYAERRHCR